jgi:hypothetical protein
MMHGQQNVKFIPEDLYLPKKKVHVQLLKVINKNLLDVTRVWFWISKRKIRYVEI